MDPVSDYDQPGMWAHVVRKLTELIPSVAGDAVIATIQVRDLCLRAVIEHIQTTEGSATRSPAFNLPPLTAQETIGGPLAKRLTDLSEQRHGAPGKDNVHGYFTWSVRALLAAARELRGDQGLTLVIHHHAGQAASARGYRMCPVCHQEVPVQGPVDAETDEAVLTCPQCGSIFRVPALNRY